MLRRYVRRLVKEWILWVIDGSGLVIFVVDLINPALLLPRELYWGITLLGFLAANVKIYAEQETRIAALEAHEANIILSVRDAVFDHSRPTVPSPFPETKINAYGFDEHGLPGWGTVWAILEGENIGEKAGDLVLKLDRVKTKLPAVFALDENNDGSFFKGPLGSIKGETRFEARWYLDVRLVEQDPSSFARTLSSLEYYRIVVNYHTRRIGGRSTERVLIIEGNFQGFREKVLEYWKSFGFSKLVLHQGEYDELSF